MLTWAWKKTQSEPDANIFPLQSLCINHWLANLLPKEVLISQVAEEIVRILRKLVSRGVWVAWSMRFSIRELRRAKIIHCNEIRNAMIQSALQHLDASA